MKLKMIFEECRIVGLAGEKNSGKTNNLISLLLDYRKENNDIPIYVYGMNETIIKKLEKYKIYAISSLKHLIEKENCILAIDEAQKLKLNDRRFKDERDEFVDFVYHNNVYAILSCPNIREFNTILGGIIERWLFKTIRIDNCVNGSQLKREIENYKGNYKKLGSIVIPKDKLLLINDKQEMILECDYIKEIDLKKENIDLFRNCQKKVKKLSEKDGMKKVL